MARSHVISNLLYGALGLAAVGTAAYFAIRSFRARRARGEDPMLSLRRSTRDADRAESQSTKKSGKRARRVVEDDRESFEAEVKAENVDQL